MAELMDQDFAKWAVERNKFVGHNSLPDCPASRPDFWLSIYRACGVYRALPVWVAQRVVQYWTDARAVFRAKLDAIIVIGSSELKRLL
jgi:hypothetical protein